MELISYDLEFSVVPRFIEYIIIMDSIVLRIAGKTLKRLKAFDSWLVFRKLSSLGPYPSVISVDRNSHLHK